MLICGTVTSIVGAVGSIANLVMTKTVMKMEKLPTSDDVYLDNLGRGGPSIPEPFSLMNYMPEVFFIGIIVVAIALYWMRREKKVIIGSEI